MSEDPKPPVAPADKSERDAHGRQRVPWLVRFWQHVQKSESCWLWMGNTDQNGYGRIGVLFRSRLAHRLSWEINRGPIPPNLHVLHRCDVPGCVNPDHLFLGTQADNVADMIKKGRKAPLPRGSDHVSSTLSEADVMEIRRLILIGMRQREVALYFRMSQAQVWRIGRRQHWRHLPQEGVQ